MAYGDTRCVVCGEFLHGGDEICDDCWDDVENDYSDVYIPDDDDDYEPTEEELQMFRDLVIRVHDKITRNGQG